MASTPITDALLDQLSDEMRQYATSLRADASLSCEDDDITLNKNLAWTLDDIATDRGLLTRFAFLLRSHSRRARALAEITGASVSA